MPTEVQLNQVIESEKQQATEREWDRDTKISDGLSMDQISNFSLMWQNYIVEL